MIRVNTTDLQNAFGKYLALTEKEDIVITKNGKNVAKLIRYTEPEFLLVREKVTNYTVIKKVNYEKYLELANSTEQRYEFIDGELYLLASPSYQHQVMVNEIFGQFYNYFRGKPCRALTAPFDVRLFGYATKFEEDPNVVQPDVLVICDHDKVQNNKYEGVPTLIVEVLSPSTQSRDMVAKLHLYMRSGVSEYWVVDWENKKVYQYSFSPDRELSNLVIFEDDDTITSTVFEDLTITLHDLFGDLQ